MKPFIYSCPPAFYESVLVPVLAHVSTHSMYDCTMYYYFYLAFLCFLSRQTNLNDPYDAALFQCAKD